MSSTKRREFIQQASVLGLAAASLPFIKLEQQFPEEKKLGVALVGLGRYSTFQLGPALQETQQLAFT